MRQLHFHMPLAQVPHVAACSECPFAHSRWKTGKVELVNQIVRDLI
jgi:hypothetical protein